MDKSLYKVLMNGKSCNGGSLEWSLPNGDAPGEWHEVAGDIILCSNGLHLTSEPAQWWDNGAECYLAEGEGDQQGDETKVAVRRARLLRRLTTDELADLRIVSEGTYTAKDGYWRASGSATVKAYDSATVKASGSATVRASGSATVKAYGSATVEAYGSATVKAYDSATVKAYDSATVKAYGSATVEAYGSATVEAYGSATVEAYDSATVKASGSATVKASGSATVKASGSATVVQSLYLNNCTITVADNAIWIDRRTSPPTIHGSCQLAK